MRERLWASRSWRRPSRCCRPRSPCGTTGPGRVGESSLHLHLHRLLGEADLLRAGVATGGSAPGGDLEDPQRTEHRDRWRHAVSTVIEWHSRHGTSAPSLVDPPTLGSGSRNRAASRRARRARPPSRRRRRLRSRCSSGLILYELDPIQVGLRTGDVQVVRRDSRHVWIQNRRRAEIEVLDIILELVTVADRPDVGVVVISWRANACRR
jgi:hypothetical protein